ncbi:MAG: Unknown protein, partial [uncultured Aureispira sp.]
YQPNCIYQKNINNKGTARHAKTDRRN